MKHILITATKQKLFSFETQGGVQLYGSHVPNCITIATFGVRTWKVPRIIGVVFGELCQCVKSVVSRICMATMVPSNPNKIYIAVFQISLFVKEDIRYQWQSAVYIQIDFFQVRNKMHFTLLLSISNRIFWNSLCTYLNVFRGVEEKGKIH